MPGATRAAAITLRETRPCLTCACECRLLKRRLEASRLRRRMVRIPCSHNHNSARFQWLNGSQEASGVRHVSSAPAMSMLWAGITTPTIFNTHAHRDTHSGSPKLILISASNSASRHQGISCLHTQCTWHPSAQPVVSIPVNTLRAECRGRPCFSDSLVPAGPGWPGSEGHRVLRSPTEHRPW